jgi:hypothetical protein
MPPSVRLKIWIRRGDRAKLDAGWHCPAKYLTGSRGVKVAGNDKKAAEAAPFKFGEHGARLLVSGQRGDLQRLEPFAGVTVSNRELDGEIGLVNSIPLHGSADKDLGHITGADQFAGDPDAAASRITCKHHGRIRLHGLRAGHQHVAEKTQPKGMSEYEQDSEESARASGKEDFAPAQMLFLVGLRIEMADGLQTLKKTLDLGLVIRTEQLIFR